MYLRRLPKSHRLAAAVKLLVTLKDQAFELHRQPEHVGLAPELQSQDTYVYREWIISHWQLVYKTIGNVAYVIALLDSRQNLEDLLSQRMLAAEL